MNPKARLRLRGLAVAALGASATAFAAPTLASDAHSSRHTFGGAPLPISLGPGGRPANGDSGGAAVSGDNRKTRLAAFHSAASNLVQRDTNGRMDVFVWQRPRGRAGLTLSRPSGKLVRASITSGGAQGNGDSGNPSLDGSLKRKPHCVAFQSTSTNLAPGAADPGSDVFVRDLRSRHTFLVSRGISADAVNPSIDGSCARVAFEAGGAVYSTRVRGGRPARVAHGTQANYSRDGSALTWSSGSAVFVRREGRTTNVGPGYNPRVSDEESGVWGVAFETTASLSGRDGDALPDVYTRELKRRGGAVKTDLISTAAGGSAYNGGITSFGTNRGIVVFGIHEGSGTALWYRNNHSGNIDDLVASGGSLGSVATSARANFVAFSSTESLSGYDRSPNTDVYFKHLRDGEPY